MATIKRKRKTSAPRKTAISVRSRKKRGVKRRTKKRGMLSELFTPATAMVAGKQIGGGAIGGLLAHFLNKATPNQTPLQKAMFSFGGAFLLASVLRQPAMGAGMAGAGTYELLQSGTLMAENGNANFAEPIEALPMFLSEDNKALLLSQGEQMVANAMNENKPVTYPGYVGYGMY
jgi:hypothetical protein